MNYKDIKEFNQRCEEHPDHQSGMISYGMISQRLQEEIDELREYIEQRTWVGLTQEDKLAIEIEAAENDFTDLGVILATEAALRRKNDR